MIRPALALERLSFLEQEGKIGYRWGRDTADQETMDYLEFIGKCPYPSMTYRWLQQASPCMSVFVRIMRILGLNPSADA